MPISGSTRNLPGGSTAAPHDIGFSPDGTRVLVTEGGTDQIDIFQLNDRGLITGVVTQHSAGSGPFGFRFGRDGALANAEANTASVSSYFLTAQDALSQISGNGAVNLESAVAASASGGAPIDSALGRILSFGVIVADYCSGYCG